MGMVSRLRQYQHAKYDAAKNDRVQSAEAYNDQDPFDWAAGGDDSALLSFRTYIAGCNNCFLFAAEDRSLLERCCGSGRWQEARDSRFMDLGTPPEVREQTPA